MNGLSIETLVLLVIAIVGVIWTAIQIGDRVWGWKKRNGIQDPFALPCGFNQNQVDTLRSSKRAIEGVEKLLATLCIRWDNWINLEQERRAIDLQYRTDFLNELRRIKVKE